MRHFSALTMLAFALVALACGGIDDPRSAPRPAVPAPASAPAATSPAAAPAVTPTGYVPAGGDKTVHVKGYTRKDGTHVQPHTRSAPHRR